MCGRSRSGLAPLREVEVVCGGVSAVPLVVVAFSIEIMEVRSKDVLAAAFKAH